MYYIQETDKPVLVARLFNLIEIIGDKIIIPVGKNEVIEDRKINSLVKKIKKVLIKTNCKSVVLSKNLKKQKNFVDLLNENDICIINGKWLFSVICDKVLDYVVKKENIEKEKTNISIMINNNDSDYIMENIKKFIREYKSVNIVTKNMEKFKRLEKEILEKEGTMITVTNNKKKSLLRSQIILNVDFNEDEVNKYNIPDEAIIVNLKENVDIKKKRFNGININDYEISFENFDEFDYDKSNLYSQKDIYEAMLYKKQPYEYIKRKLEKDKVSVVELIGKRNSF